MPMSSNPCADLRRFSLFDGLSEAYLERLRQQTHRQTFEAGTRLFERGDPGGVLMLICRGEVEILLPDAAQHEVVLRVLGDGATLGEFSLLDQRPRSASARALTPLDVLVLERRDFLAFLSSNPLAGLTMMRTLAERIRYTTAYLETLNEAVEHLQAGHADAHLTLVSAPNTPEFADMQALISSFLTLARRFESEEQKKPRDGG